MSDEIKKHIKDQNTWIRGLYILMFSLIYSVTEIVIFMIVLFQFVFVLLTSKPNDKLLVLGMDLSTYVFQILSYLTFNSCERPYPFSDFPSSRSDE